MNTDVLFDGFNEHAPTQPTVNESVIEYLENNHKLLNEFKFTEGEI